MIVDQSNCPQHMNVFKHLVYIWTRSGGNHSMWSWGLNQRVMTLVSSHTVTQEFLQLPKLFAKEYGGCGMMVDPYDHPQHMKVLNLSEYISGLDMGTIPSGSGASTKAQWYCLVATHCDTWNSSNSQTHLGQ